MRFFSTVISVCSGTSGFPELMKRNPFYALFHLLLLSLLLSFILTGAAVYDAGNLTRPIVSALEEQFGTLVISPSGVLPLKNAEKPKTFLLPFKKTRLDYLPAASALNRLDDMDSWTERTGLLWLPKGFCLWQRAPEDKDKYVLVHLPLPQPVPVRMGKGETFLLMFAPVDFISYSRLTRADLQTYLRKNYLLAGSRVGTIEKAPSPAAGTDGKKNAEERGTATSIVPALPVAEDGTLPVLRTTELSMKTIGDRVLMLYAGIYYFFFGLLPLFSVAFLTTLIFSLVQHFMSLRQNPKMTFGNVYSAMIYAAFPALIGAVLFAAFAPPFLSFTTVFFVIFFIYHLFAFRTIQRALYPPPPKTNDDSEDDDYF